VTDDCERRNPVWAIPNGKSTKRATRTRNALSSRFLGAAGRRPLAKNSIAGGISDEPRGDTFAVAALVEAKYCRERDYLLAGLLDGVLGAGLSISGKEKREEGECLEWPSNLPCSPADICGINISAISEAWKTRYINTIKYHINLEQQLNGHSLPSPPSSDARFHYRERKCDKLARARALRTSGLDSR